MHFQNKINFLCPTSPTNSIAQPNFVVNSISSLSQEPGLSNFSVTPRQVPISQVSNRDENDFLLFPQLSLPWYLPCYYPLIHNNTVFRFIHREKLNILPFGSGRVLELCPITFLFVIDNEQRVRTQMLLILLNSLIKTLRWIVRTHRQIKISSWTWTTHHYYMWAATHNLTR